MKTCLPWLPVVFLATLAATQLCAAQGLATENHRIRVHVLDPDAAPVSTWRVKLHATYRPLVQGAPNTTETTTSRANCSSASRLGGSIFTSFERCTRTRDRMLRIELPATQVTVADARTLDLNLAPVIEDHGGTFRIDDLTLEYMACANGCEEKRVEMSLTCFADDVEHGDVVAGGLVLNYTRGAQAPAEAAQCGLRAGNEIGWSNHDMVMTRVRGHYGPDQQRYSRELLNAFSAIPTADHRWLWNPARGKGPFDDYCTLPNDQSYENTRLMATLKPQVGWPFRHEAEVFIISKPNGEVCEISLTGTADETYLRYEYDYADGQLTKVSTSGEPDDVTRVWRWVKGEPWEFSRRQTPSSVAKQNILYWHKTAAEQWPERMDYTPDFEQFNALSTLSQQLLKRFAVKQN
jgi:hypothetical protein